jgi:hypothetical protein
MIPVNFINVGRNKISWTAKTAEVNYEWLYNQVKSKGALLSRDIEFMKEHNKGIIFAGFHHVGQFEIVTETVTN